MWTKTDYQVENATKKEITRTKVLMMRNRCEIQVIETTNFMLHTNHSLHPEILKDIDGWVETNTTLKILG